jgi:LmbE family N-acetylglucosaminyl deacetylase
VTSATILLSPHLDDIAYAVGGSLLKKAFPPPYKAVTVFSKSAYSPFSSAKLSPEEATRVRKDEDRAYFSSLGIDVIHLDLPEAYQLRGYTSLKSIFEVRQSIDDPIFNDAAEKIHQTMASFSGGYLVMPLGIGNHVDHLIVSDACLSTGPRWRRIYYEDLPYATSYPLSRIAKIAYSLDHTAKPSFVELRHEIQQKLRNLQLYQSQVSGHELGVVANYATRVGRGKGSFERLWTRENNYEGSSEDGPREAHVGRRLHLLDIARRNISKALGIWW